MTNNKRHDNYLLLLLTGACLIIFVFLYCWLGTLSPLPAGQPIPLHRQLLLLLQNVLAGSIGALISFVVVYLLFTSQGISFFKTDIIKVMNDIIETTNDEDLRNTFSELIQKFLNVSEKPPLNQKFNSISQRFSLHFKQNELGKLEEEIENNKLEIDQKINKIMEGFTGISTEEKEIEKDLENLLTTFDKTKYVISNISNTVDQIRQQIPVGQQALDLGIKRIWKQRKDIPKNFWCEFIQEAKEEVWLFGIAEYGYASDSNFKKIVEERTKEGCSFRILLLDPESDAAQWLDNMEAGNRGSVQGRIQGALSFFNSIKENHVNQPGQFKIHISDYIPHVNIVRGDSKLLITQYMPPLLGYERLTIQLQDIPEGIFGNYVKYFEKTWKQSKILS